MILREEDECGQVTVMMDKNECDQEGEQRSSCGDRKSAVGVQISLF